MYPIHFFKCPLLSDQHLQNFPFQYFNFEFFLSPCCSPHTVLFAAKKASEFLTQNKTQRMLSLI